MPHDIFSSLRHNYWVLTYVVLLKQLKLSFSSETDCRFSRPMLQHLPQCNKTSYSFKGPICIKVDVHVFFDYKAGLGSILILWKYQSLREIHTACIQKLSLKTSRQDFWNFVMSQQRSRLLSAKPQAPPTWTHHPTLQDVFSLTVNLKCVIFLFDYSEISHPIRRETQILSSDWLTDLLLLELQREAWERQCKTTLRWFLVLKTTNMTGYQHFKENTAKV